MNGLSITMLAILVITLEDQAVFYYVPSLLAVAGLIASFLRRCPWWMPVAIAVIGCGMAPAAAMLTKKEWVRSVWLNDVFLEWKLADEHVLFAKAPFILGAITLIRVYYLYRKGKSQRQRHAAVEGYTTKTRSI